MRKGFHYNTFSKYRELREEVKVELRGMRDSLPVSAARVLTDVIPPNNANQCSPFVNGEKWP